MKVEFNGTVLTISQDSRVQDLINIYDLKRKIVRLELSKTLEITMEPSFEGRDIIFWIDNVRNWKTIDEFTIEVDGLRIYSEGHLLNGRVV